MTTMPRPGALPKSIGIPTCPAMQQRPLGSILSMHTVPSAGGGTIFASQQAAYDVLSPSFKSFLDGLTATHSGDHLYRCTHQPAARAGRAEQGLSAGGASRCPDPPVTKRKGLFVNQGSTTQINELSPEESRSVRDFLFVHRTRPAFRVRFRWQPNAVAFWDNRAVRHSAMSDHFAQVRSGYRVMIQGDRPY